MELRVLKYFLTVADEGNITRAADILHVVGRRTGNGAPDPGETIRDFDR